MRAECHYRYKYNTLYWSSGHTQWLCLQMMHSAFQVLSLQCNIPELASLPVCVQEKEKQSAECSVFW